MVRWVAANWDVNQFVSVRLGKTSTAMVARSLGEAVSVETVYDRDRPVSQRFATTEYFIVNPSVQQVGRVWTAGSFAKAVSHHRIMAAAVVGLLDAQQELSEFGGAPAVLEGAL
jgi:hypothetical protein